MTTSSVKKALEAPVQTALCKQHVTHETLLATIQASAAASGKIVTMMQSNFDLGTILIDRTGYTWADNGVTTRVPVDTSNYVFKLGSNISFNASPPAAVTAEGVWAAGNVPTNVLGSFYPHQSFGLGWFTAIACSAKDVVIDLQGYTISQSPTHQLLQRFFSNIELSDSPFEVGQGPHDFTSKITSAENVVITNGNIGSAAHHGIHSNSTRNIFLKSLNFSQYEVAACHMSGAENTSIVDCTISTSNNKIPTRGAFSATRFLRPYLDVCVTQNVTATINGSSITASEIRNALRDAQFSVFTDVITNAATTGGFIDQAAHSAEWHLFDNPSPTRVVDGNAYGISYGQKGVSVGPFPDTRAKMSTNLFMKNVTISSHHANVSEVPALKGTASGSPQNDPIGALSLRRQLGAVSCKRLTKLQEIISETCFQMLKFW